LENKIDGVVLMLVDVDRLKHSEAEIRRLAELLEKTFEPILMWDAEGTIVYWNRGAEETYGYPRAQAMGSSHHKLLKIAPDELGFHAVIEQNGVWTGELRHTRRDGQIVVVESRMTLVRDHHGNRMVIETTRPITERKEKELALRLRAEELARADQAKNEFIAMLAHELRNPLAPLRNALEVLKVGHVDTPTSERMHDMMDRQVLRITRMVNDLLDVARITQGKVALQKETVDLREVIGRAVESMRLHLEGRKHDLRIELPSEPVYVEGDDVRLDQIFTNLLDNAAKFTPSGGHIEVHAQLVRRAASPTRDQIMVRIRDDGVGIEAAVLPHVFDLFIQADHSLDRARGGLGIGLTLVKRLVELHGGSIDAHSAGLGQGSEFVIHLDTVEVRAAQEQSPPDEPAAGPSQRRILVVDDNVDSAQSLAALLELSGHLVKVAYDAQHALDTAAAFCPHTVLLDIGLPGMNGFEVAKRLRRLAPTRKAFIVAVSGYGQEEHRRAAQEAGFDAFVTKPVAYGQLADLLSQHSGR
jgi:two-component system CheB/CheR fusion protein